MMNPPSAYTLSSPARPAYLGLVGMLVIGLLSWLHYTQHRVLHESSRQLAELRQARIELTQGFLQVSLADKPESPFSRDEGQALLRQSIDTFERALASLHMQSGPETENFRRSVEAFRPRLNDWRNSARPDVRELVALRIAFADLDRSAHHLDTLGHRHIASLRADSDRVYAWSLAGSLLALGLIAGIVLYSTRREQMAADEQARLERARGDSEARFTRLFHEAPLPLCLVDSTGVLRARNRRFDQTFGFSHDELRYLDDWWPLAYPDPTYRAWVLENWNTAFAEAASQDAGIAPIEYKVTCKGGGERVMLISGISLGEDFLASFFDVTERKQAEQAQAHALAEQKAARLAALNQMEDANAARRETERTAAALRESQERLQLLIDHAPAALAMFDRDMRYLAVSQRWRDDYALGERDILGHSHYEIFPEIPETWRAVHQRGMAGEIVMADEDRFDRADGSTQWLRWEMRPWHAQNGGIGGIVIFSEDITRLMAARHEILELNAGLERRVAERTAELSAANRELDAFAYAVSHDLRAPLRAMNGFAQALEEDYGERLDGEAKNYLAQIGIASRRMGDLIEGILTLSRSTRGELRRDVADLSAMVNRQIEELARHAPQRRVEWTVQPDLTADGDARMLEAVVMNLIGNAWNYSARRNPAHIRFFAEERDGQRWFCVADDGAGFDPAHANRLFQPFQRLHRQDEFPGLGIGLATVARIVHRHGGEIEARGEVGKGARFCFTLPEADCPHGETAVNISSSTP